MTVSKKSRPFAFTAIALPLALGLAACNGSDDAEGSLDSEPVAEVPAPDGQEWADVATRTEYDGYQIGNPDAPIKIVEYASYTCPACAQFSQTSAEPLREEYINSGRVSFELRNLVRDSVDLAVARLVRCTTPEAVVPLSDQWWGNFQQVMTQVQQGSAGIDQALASDADDRFVGVGEAAGLYDFFASRGLSRDQARTCLADSEEITAIADRSQAQAEEFDVTGTPTIFINGQKIDENGWPAIEAALQRAGARDE